MKNKVLSSLFILCFAFGYSQTNKLGVNVNTPTESLDANGTARLRDLPLNGTPNAIYTQADGKVSPVKNQTFNAVKTVVVDENGVMGAIDGVAITEAPDVKTIQYSRSTTLINSSTPDNSVTTIGNLSIRFNHTGTGSNNSIEFKTKVANQVTAFAEVSGSGGNYYADWRTTSAKADTWTKATGQGVTAANRDTYNLMITLHNSQEIYRVSLICNGLIKANTSLGIPEVPAQVNIFIEKLQ